MRKKTMIIFTILLLLLFLVVAEFSKVKGGFGKPQTIKFEKKK